jgi:hypothetical protein
MAEVAQSSRSLADIAAFYRELPAAQNNAASLSLADLVDHLAEEYKSCHLICWTSMFTLCISQHRWNSPADWMPFLMIEPCVDGQIEFRYRDSQVSKLDWARVVPPEAAIGRFDAFIDQLRWRPAISRLAQTERRG